jgi:hypothetical protein
MFRNFTLPPKSVFMLSVSYPQNSGYFAKQQQPFDFVMETKRVLCEVETEFL